MDVFRHVAGSNGTLKFNYRPRQELGDRKVYHRLDGYTPNASTTAFSPAVIVCAILSILLVRLLR